MPGDALAAAGEEPGAGAVWDSGGVAERGRGVGFGGEPGGEAGVDVGPRDQVCVEGAAGAGVGEVSADRVLPAGVVDLAVVAAVGGAQLAGAAAGTNSMMRYLGSIIGAGMLGAILSSDGAAPEIGVFKVIFAVLLVMSVLAALTTLMIHRFPPHERTIEVDPLPLGALPATEVSNA